jgi:hypothetical protein
LTEVRVDALVEMKGQFAMLNNDILTTVSFTNMTHSGDTLWFEGNPALSSLDFASLEDVGDRYWLYNNESLCSSDVAALLSLIRSRGWAGTDVSDYGNDDSC